MKNSEITLANESFVTTQDEAGAPHSEANNGFELLSDDLLMMVGGGDSAVCW